MADFDNGRPPQGTDVTQNKATSAVISNDKYIAEFAQQVSSLNVVSDIAESSEANQAANSITANNSDVNSLLFLAYM